MKYAFFFLIIFLASCNNQVEKPINQDQTEIQKEKPVTKDSSQTSTKLTIDPQKIANQFKQEDAVIVHSVIQTSLWGKENCIIVFYESRFVNDDEYKHESQFVDACLLIPNTRNEYQKVVISRFEDDNVDSEIQSVFFANADSDPEKELIILSTCSHRLQYLYDGTEYSTSVFDNFDSSNPPKKMIYLSKISALLDGGFEGFLEENPNSKARFKTASEIKRELKRLGY